MQDLFGSVRRSLVFRTTPDNNLITDNNENQDTLFNNTPPFAGALVEKLNSCIRKSRVFSKPISNFSSSSKMSPAIRWRKGELIGCGAFGSVYMGMNLDSGELLAVKQVLVAANSASKEKTQAHIKELEEEVKLLKDLSHPNIVRYLGTVREEDSLNILLEFVPGGSISSLLGKFGAFPEAVIRTYTEQLLLGLQYLHSNGIMHRDIKGPNILVDNKGCIKLADFGASKQVVELATVSGAKSMKGTPYWMAPEVIRQTGHSFSADIWSVGCTVIEMATGKPPWSQQYQEVAAALFHIGMTKSHPPIPDHLSAEAKDFLLNCLQEEPSARPTASELLKLPFVTGVPVEELHPVSSPSCREYSQIPSSSCGLNLENVQASKDVLCNLDSLSCSTIKNHVFETSNDDEDMCQLSNDFSLGEGKLSSVLMAGDLNKSSDPMCEGSDGWRYNDEKPLESVPSRPSICEDDDELTESKIKAFLDEKAVELKKLQTPLYEEFYNSLNSPSLLERVRDETSPNYLKLPPKSRSPNRVPPSVASDSVGTGSPGSNGRRVSNVSVVSDQNPKENSSPQRSNWKEPSSPNMSFTERQRKWKEELDEELDILRQAGIGGKTSSPKDRVRQRDRTRFASPGK